MDFGKLMMVFYYYPVLFEDNSASILSDSSPFCTIHMTVKRNREYKR